MEYLYSPDTNMLQKQLKPFKDYTLQWHLLNQCNMNCSHCYIKDRQQKMSLAQFTKGLNNYVDFLNHFKIQGRIYFTGGDPLLHKSLKKIISMTVSHNISFALMGNYHCLTTSIVRFLKKNKIRFYQLSIDGLKTNHEAVRGEETFDKVLAAIDLLESNGVTTVVNMTVTRQNIDDVIPLIKLLAETKLSRFDTTRVVPIGSALQQKDQLIIPARYKKLLQAILQTEAILKEKGKKLQIGKKDHLWTLLYEENDKLAIDLSNMYYGCGMVIRHLTILPDGDILPCRKLELPIGNILKQPLSDIFLKNKLVGEICSNSLVRGCSKCKLNNVCRGCPSVTHAYFHNLDKRDPQCWKK